MSVQEQTIVGDSEGDLGVGAEDPAGPGVLRWRFAGTIWEGLVRRTVDGNPVTEWVPAVLIDHPHE